MYRRRTPVLVALGLLIAAAIPAPAAASDQRPGAVYVQSNDPAGNTILAFARASDGSLTTIGTYPTGGRGSGDSLGSQGSLALSRNGRWLLAVNAGSDDISSFRVRRDGALRLVDREASGGDRPISVTVHRDLVYALNAGGDSNIAGLRLGENGGLRSLSGSWRPLSGAAPEPAQIAFDPDGDVLVVTEKATNLIDTYRVRSNGRTAGPRTTPSAGPTPFGFEFDHQGRAFVSEAAGGAPNASLVSSYDVSGRGRVEVISPAVPTTQTAACWVEITGDGRFAFVTNTGSGSVSTYAIAADGSITLEAAVGASTGAGSSPIDMALSHDGGYLYVLESGTDAVSSFSIGPDGSLTPIAELTGLPATSVGLAGR